jgi:hypothetical protein
MKSILTVDRISRGLPVFADDLIEFHASRLLLLLRICGTDGKLDSLTKMAKLDFFARYPSFFRRITHAESTTAREDAIESAMVRFHYGPWDHRYYDVLGYLVARGLVELERHRNRVEIRITSEGRNYADALAVKREFRKALLHLRSVKAKFGAKSGNALKELIYRHFDAEVTKRSMGEIIR